MTGKNAAIVAVALCILLGIACWVREREARIRAEVEGRMHQAEAELAGRQADGAIKAAAVVAAQSREQLAALERERLKPHTTRDIIREIPHLIPMPGKMAETPVEEARAFSSATHNLSAYDSRIPDSPGHSAETGAVLDPDQLEALRDFAYKCQACSIERDALREEIVQKDSAIDAREREVAAQRQRAEAAERGLRGGSRWQRFAHSLKCIAASGAAAGIGAAASGARGAAVGGAVGAGLCAIF